MQYWPIVWNLEVVHYLGEVLCLEEYQLLHPLSVIRGSIG